jgi:integrase
LSTRSRVNGEGSIFPYRNGYAAYVWVTTPAGLRKRKYVYGKTREIVHEKWVKLMGQSRQGAVATSVPKLGEYLNSWLVEVIEPNRAPLTYTIYESHVRLHIAPYLGAKRLDKLSVRDVQTWLNALRRTCVCCSQGKDARRPESAQKCCGKGQCCEDFMSDRSVSGVRAVLRSALSQAIKEELIGRNVAMSVTVPTRRKRKRQSWTSDEARAFLESARDNNDPMYPAYVLVLALGLRKGEVLGLTWDDVDLAGGALAINHQLQRAQGRLYHRETKTEESDDVTSQGYSLVDHAGVGGIQGVPVRASVMASTGRRPWLRALVR